jgi:hypothetical protein
MKNIEKKLNRLPRAKLSRKADWQFKFLLYKTIIKKKFLTIVGFGVLRERAFVCSVILLILSFVVLPSYAYASKKVTVGHILYPVKVMVENVELNLSENKTEKLLKFSLRRIEEAEVVASKKQNKQNITTLMNESVKLKNKAIEHSSEKNDIYFEKYNDNSYEALLQVAVDVGVESDDDVIDAVALTLESVKKNDEKKVNIRNQKKGAEALSAEDGNIPKIEKKKYKLEDDKGSKSSLRVDKNNTKPSPRKQKKHEIGNLKKEVKKLEFELKKENYKKDDVELMMKKLHTRIDKAEKEPNKQKLKKIINPTSALIDNAKLFIEKNSKENRRGKKK